MQQRNQTRAMAQTVSCHFLTAETQFRFQGRQRGIYGGQSGIGRGLSPRLSLFLRHYHFSAARSPFMYHLGDQQWTR
jgi:hypothetical protein